jgi:hypothetical protein
MKTTLVVRIVLGLLLGAAIGGTLGYFGQCAGGG